MPYTINTGQEDYFMIELYASNAPKVTTLFKPSLEMIDYVTYMLSCIGFWIGISPIGLLCDFKKLVKKKHKRNIISHNKLIFGNSSNRNENNQLQFHERRITGIENLIRQSNAYIRFLQTSNWESRLQPSETTDL